MAMEPSGLAELLGISAEELEAKEPEDTSAPPPSEYFGEKRRQGSENLTYDLTLRLCIAAEKGHVNIARLVLEAGAKVNTLNARGLTPLVIASDRGHVDIVQMLLEQKAGPSTMCTDGSCGTPLHSAAKRGDVEVAKLLLAARADVHARCGVRGRRVSDRPVDTCWLTPLQFACSWGRLEVVKLLLETHQSTHGDCDALLRASSAAGTAMHCAAQKGDPALIRLLHSYG